MYKMSDGELVFFLLNEAECLTKSELNFLESLVERQTNFCKGKPEARFLTEAERVRLKKLILKVPE